MCVVSCDVFDILQLTESYSDQYLEQKCVRINPLMKGATINCSISYKSWLISNLMHKIIIYLHILHLLKSSTCFEHYPAHIQEVYVVIVYMQPLVSSLSAGDCLVHRLRKNFFLNWCTGQTPAERTLLS